jgi:Holliday junction resolvase RusA-like endonuclease
MNRVELFLPGDPPCKERPRASRSGHIYTPQKTRDSESEIAIEFMALYPVGYFEPNTALEISVFAGFATPKKPKYLVPTKKDLDNIIKIVMDGLNKVAYHDDSWICSIRDSGKFYADNPGVLVVLQELEGKKFYCPSQFKKYFFKL